MLGYVGYCMYFKQPTMITKVCFMLLFDNPSGARASYHAESGHAILAGAGEARRG